MQQTKKPASGDCDAFLSYSSQNRAAARELKLKLEARRISVWFDEDQLKPGSNWQGPVETALQRSGSVVVAIGSGGMGPWQNEETQAALHDAVEMRRPVIPVLLPGCPTTPPLNLFLRNRAWVDFRDGYSDYQIDRLVWGIKGEKPSLIEESTKTRADQSSIITRWILVAGSGGGHSVPPNSQDVSRRLGEALAIDGFSLVTGGWDGVDEYVARAFAEQIQRDGQSLSGRLVQVMQNGARPQFPAGRLDINGSEEAAWKRSIERSDAVVLIGGLGGTFQTGEWAEGNGKFVFPLADTRGPAGDHADAYKFYFKRLENWRNKNPLTAFLSPDEYSSLGNPAPGVVSDLIRLLKQVLVMKQQ